MLPTNLGQYLSLLTPSLDAGLLPWAPAVPPAPALPGWDLWSHTPAGGKVQQNMKRHTYNLSLGWCQTDRYRVGASVCPVKVAVDPVHRQPISCHYTLWKLGKGEHEWFHSFKSYDGGLVVHRIFLVRLVYLSHLFSLFNHILESLLTWNQLIEKRSDVFPLTLRSIWSIVALSMVDKRCFT